MSKQLGIHFGALAEPISEQLKQQGFDFDKEEVADFEDQLRSIIKLYFSDLLTDTMKNKISDKLYKKILRHVTTKNKLQIV